MTEPHVTDHAVLRYMERVLDIDVERLRATISESCARHQGAPCVRAGGARFLMNKGVVVTCLADRTVPHFAVLANLIDRNGGQ